MKKKLVRNTNNKMIAGVVSGVADYLGVDTTMLRLVTVVGFIFTGFAPLGFIYIFAWILMPEDSGVDYEVVQE